MVATKRIPPLGAVRVFEAASRHGSFVRAAAELSVTPAAVSQQVKQLEHWLGATLFERTPNGVVLTAGGHEYALRIRDVFDVLISTTVDARDTRKRPIVTIRSQFSVASLWLTSRIATLQNMHPEIEIALHAMPERTDSRINPDLMLYESVDAPSYQRECAFSGKFRVYGAPALVAKLPRATPKALLSSPLIHTVTARRLRDPTFSEWFELAGVDAPKAVKGARFNLVHLTASACIAGVGFALLLDEFCLPSLRAGSLVAIKGPEIVSQHPVYLYTRKNPSAETLLVRDWLLNSRKG